MQLRFGLAYGLRDEKQLGKLQSKIPSMFSTNALAFLDFCIDITYITCGLVELSLSRLAVLFFYANEFGFDHAWSWIL